VPDTAAYDLSVAAESSLPLNGLRVSVVPDNSPNAQQSTYVIHVPAPDLTWKASANGESTASIYVLAASFDEGNKMVGHITQAMKAIAKPGTNLQDASHAANFFLTTKPASHSARLRFIVRDSASGKMGSTDVKLGK